MSSAINPKSELLSSLIDHFLVIQEKITTNLESQARRWNLCANQLLVLMDVKNHPGTSLQELCQRTGIKKSLASKHVESLVTKGWLNRKSALEDRRSLVLEVTPVALERGFCSNQSLQSLFSSSAIAAIETTQLDLIRQALADLAQLIATIPPDSQVGVSRSVAEPVARPRNFGFATKV